MERRAQSLEHRRTAKQKGTPDILLIALILLIVSFGIVMVYSASSYHAQTNYNDPFYIVKRQFGFGILGVIGMIFIGVNFNYKVFSNLKIAGMVYGSSILLALSLFVIGHESKGATRWIKIGSITIQPSEFVKIGVILMLSAYIVEYRRKLDNFLYVIGGAIIVLIPAGIVAVENLSSAIVVASVGFIILFISTPKVWYYVVAIVGAVGFGFLAYHLAMTTDPAVEIAGPLGTILKQYRLDRFRVWIDPWIAPLGGGYQPIQSLLAIGSGGLFGQGLSLGIQKQGFLPEPHNDIIFAVICEELGLFGAVCLLLTYSLLIMRGLTIAFRADDYFGSLVATGIVAMVAVQVLINVAVNTNTLPTTGMQLPLVSYGGTALIILLGSLGILVNISKMSRVDKPPLR